MADRIEAVLRLRDAARFQSDARRSAAAVRSIGDAESHVNRQGTLASRAQDRFGGALTAIGAASRTAALGLGVVGGGALTMGIKFNASMEQNTVAFSNFLGSTTKAEAYLKDLYKVASKTPFEFPELVGAARKFLAFGFTAQKTKDILNVVGDTVAGIGGGAPEIDRLTMAIGQIQAKGKLSTEELLQMAELGVPAFAILKKELGLTGAELEKQLRGGSISAKEGIGALMKGLDQQFKGSSKSQSKTFLGQLSTMKDNFNKFLGDLSKPLFNWASKHLLPGMNKAMASVGKAAPKAMAGLSAGFGGKGAGKDMKGVAGVAQDVGKALKSGFGAAKGAVVSLLDALKPAKPLFDNVIFPLLKGLAKGVIGSVVVAFKVLVPIIKVVAQVLGFLGTILKPLKPVFEGIGMAIGFLFAGPILKGIGLLGKFGGVFRVVGVVAKTLAVPVRALGAVFGILFRAVARVSTFMIGAFRHAAVAVINGLTRAWSFFRGLGSKFLGAAKNIVVSVVKGLAGFAGKVTAPIRSGIGKALSVVSGAFGKFKSFGGKLWTNLVNGLKSAIGSGAKFAVDLGKKIANAVINLLNSALPDSIGKGPFKVNVPDIPTFATGGVMNIGGAALVGERGPEIVNLPGGSRVTPLPALPDISPINFSAAARGYGVAKVYLDRRQIAEATFDEVEDQRARA